MPDGVLLGSDSVLMSVLGCRYRITGKAFHFNLTTDKHQVFLKAFNYLVTLIQNSSTFPDNFANFAQCCMHAGGTRQAFAGLELLMREITTAVGEAAGGKKGRLWTALQSGGFFDLLLARRFHQVFKHKC